MQTSSKKEVSCKALDPLFYFAKQNNVDLNKLVDGLPYNLSYLMNKRERIFWSDWCKIISNARTFFSAFEFEEMGRQFVKSNSYKAGLLAAFFIFSSKKFSQYLARLIIKNTSAMFTCIKQKFEFINTNHVRISIAIDKEYEFCPEFFYLSKGYWGELGAGLGHKNFRFDMSIVNSIGIFNAFWNRENFVFRMKRRLRWLLNIKQVFMEMTESQTELMKQYEKTRLSQNLLQKQRIQLKVADDILKSIKQTDDIKETLNSVSTTLINTSNFSAVFIELFRDLDENQLNVNTQAGDFKDSSVPVKRIISIDNKYIGNLIAYPKQNMDYMDFNNLLDYLIPLISITIYNTLILNANVDYKNNLKLKVSERTNELQKARDELDRTNKLLHQTQLIQNNFFANISHEFRTPLTLILGPAKHLFEKLNDKDVKEQLDLIHRSAKKLNRLVDELLEISKIESGEMKLRVCPVNLVTAVKEMSLSFYSLAERKNINFRVSSDEDELIAYVDKEKFDKIFTNVLANAFKFTPEEGKVAVNLRKYKKQAEIQITDTGMGIPHDQVDKIFDRFYQVDSSHTKSHEGTGIGLSLTKELIELHKGRIEVESEEGKGSTFKLYFPLGKDHLKPEEICEEQYEFKQEEEITLEVNEEFSNKKNKQVVETAQSIKPTLLIAEDNSDVRKYISMILENQYEIFEAANGEEGLDKSFKLIPDLIISDIMMPGLDGFQMCRKLKTDERTSHIPLIMLTAKATVQDKVNGLEVGADDYIMKPFEAKELKARISNLLEQRKRLHHHFQKYGFTDIDEKLLVPIDQKFLQNAVDVISKHISDTTFSVEVFADKLSVSRSLLVKKIEAFFGESPNELIRRIRLNKAARLIERDYANISEIALEVGFSNPSYFAECFKKQFGVSPSQYHNKK